MADGTVLVHGYPSAVADYCREHGLDQRKVRVTRWEQIRGHGPGTRLVLVYCAPLDMEDREKLVGYARARGIEVEHG